MHKHLIKWLSKILKRRKRSVTYARLLGDALEVCYDVRKTWLLAWYQNKHIIYYMFHILILKLLLIFHTSPLLRFRLHHCAIPVRDFGAWCG